tara:strand:- start:4501 stop:5118 length:618 start_codon:yes stop_codon:yes gene_type:complete
MDNQVLKDGLENGVIAALWAFIPGILILTSTENDSDFDLLLDFLGLMILFPVIIVIVSIISAQKHSLPSDIMLNCISCCVSSAIFFNLVLQFFFYVNASIDDTQFEFELSELISLNILIKSLLLGLFSGIFVITNKLKSSEVKKDELIDDNLPPKPTWDPRIEKLKQQLIIVNKEIEQLKNPTSVLSDDGNYQWNGAEWIPVNQQ